VSAACRWISGPRAAACAKGCNSNAAGSCACRFIEKEKTMTMRNRQALARAFVAGFSEARRMTGNDLYVTTDEDIGWRAVRYVADLEKKEKDHGPDDETL
jgi:hypothetical protein